MFELINKLPMPVVAVVHGAVYGGAVGLAATCDWVLAYENSRFV